MYTHNPAGVRVGGVCATHRQQTRCEYIYRQIFLLVLGECMCYRVCVCVLQRDVCIMCVYGSERTFGNRGVGLHSCLFVHASTSPFKSARTQTPRCGAAEVQNTVLVERTTTRRGFGETVGSERSRVFLWPFVRFTPPCCFQFSHACKLPSS